MADVPERCPRCGEAGKDERCPQCGREPGAAGLRLLPPPASADPDPEPVPGTRLIREFKGPTVEDLIDGSARRSEELPGQVQRVLAALESGDLPGAEAALDESLGSVLHGPGFARRQSDLRALVLLRVLFLLLCLATALTWIFAGNA